MEVDFTPEQVAQLSKIARHDGKNTAQLVKEAALRLLDDDTCFRAAVREGFASLARGEFIEEEEMGTRVTRMLQR